ncbi:hypothetical protein ANN_22932 [Periplaneta americana]|uniref:Histone-lysine N-methyltransferase SETMAR n=1 Tax=Periplaneta americana TaxID=6978 RepID=A0ABQ8SKV8_PERAM|nr:hypothetical protein ANN_22932 [Periplaneta americana]
MSPGSSTESYPAFARIGLRENPGKNLNQVTCPDRDSNPGHLVSQPDALTVTPQRCITYAPEKLPSKCGVHSEEYLPIRTIAKRYCDKMSQMFFVMNGQYDAESDSDEYDYGNDFGDSDYGEYGDDKDCDDRYDDDSDYGEYGDDKDCDDRYDDAAIMASTVMITTAMIGMTMTDYDEYGDNDCDDSDYDEYNKDCDDMYDDHSDYDKYNKDSDDRYDDDSDYDKYDDKDCDDRYDDDGDYDEYDDKGCDDRYDDHMTNTMLTTAMIEKRSEHQVGRDQCVVQRSARNDDRKGILLVELLERNATINSERYCKTLTNLKRAIQNKRRGMLNSGVIFLHDNARPHTARRTATKLQEFNWEVLDHPPYSPDLAPSDYHLFMYIKTWLGSKRFDDDEELKTGIVGWLQSQAAELYDCGISKLVKRYK